MNASKLPVSRTHTTYRRCHFSCIVWVCCSDIGGAYNLMLTYFFFHWQTHLYPEKLSTPILYLYSSSGMEPPATISLANNFYVGNVPPPTDEEKNLIELCKQGFDANKHPRLQRKGYSASYKMYGGHGKEVAIFKPIDEEMGCEMNPKMYQKPDQGFVVGGGAYREFMNSELCWHLLEQASEDFDEHCKGIISSINPENDFELIHYCNITSSPKQKIIFLASNSLLIEGAALGSIITAAGTTLCGFQLLLFDFFKDHNLNLEDEDQSSQIEIDIDRIKSQVRAWLLVWKEKPYSGYLDHIKAKLEIYSDASIKLQEKYRNHDENSNVDDLDASEDESDASGDETDFET